MLHIALALNRSFGWWRSHERQRAPNLRRLSNTHTDIWFDDCKIELIIWQHCVFIGYIRILFMVIIIIRLGWHWLRTHFGLYYFSSIFIVVLFTWTEFVCYWKCYISYAYDVHNITSMLDQTAELICALRDKKKSYSIIVLGSFLSHQQNNKHRVRSLVLTRLPACCAHESIVSVYPSTLSHGEQWKFYLFIFWFGSFATVRNIRSKKRTLPMCVPLNWIRTTKTTERLSKVSEPSLSCLMWILLMIKKKIIANRRQFIENIGNGRVFARCCAICVFDCAVFCGHTDLDRGAHSSAAGAGGKAISKFHRTIQ